MGSVEELAERITAIDVKPGESVRTFTAHVGPRIVNLIGVAYDQEDNTQELDVVLFALNTFLQTSVAFGYYHAEREITNNNVDDNTTDTSAEVTAAAFGFIFRCFQIFEYDNNDGVDGFQISTGTDRDTINGRYFLSSLFVPWKPITLDRINKTDADGKTIPVFVVTCETLDEVFLMRFTCSGNPLDVEGAILDPNSIKISVRIKWFNNPNHLANILYTTGPSDPALHPNAQVGLFSGLLAKNGKYTHRISKSDETPSVSLDFNGKHGFFQWEKSAEVSINGYENVRSVHAEVITDFDDVGPDSTLRQVLQARWSARVMLFSFDGERAEEVYWDPEFGGKASLLQVSGTLLLLVALLKLFV